MGLRAFPRIGHSREGIYSKTLWRGTGDRLTGVVKLAAVVRSGEEGDQLALGKELVTVFNHLEENRNSVQFQIFMFNFNFPPTKPGRQAYLVSSAYQVKVMFVKELGHHLPRSQLVKNKLTKEKKKLIKLFKKEILRTSPLPQM